MSDIEHLLKDYLITLDQCPKGDEEKVESDKDIIDLNTHLTCGDNWKIFFDQSFDTSQLKVVFNTLQEDERVKIFKFGITCIISFIRCNFTGPELEKETEDYLKREQFTSIPFNKLLSVNNEEINVNTKFPALLVTSKVIFEWCIINNVINNWWYWRSILIHQAILEELSPTLLSDADRLYKHFQVNVGLKGKF